MKTMMTDAVSGIDLDIIEEFIIMDKRFAKDKPRLSVYYISRYAAAACLCVVIAIGAGALIPKLISPGISDPSDDPSVPSITEPHKGDKAPSGDKGAAGDKGEAGAPGGDGEPSGDSSPTSAGSELGIGFLFDRSYDVKNEYVEFTIYYGHRGINKYKANYFDITFEVNGEKHLIRRLSKDEFKDNKYYISHQQQAKVKDGDYFDINLKTYEDLMEWFDFLGKHDVSIRNIYEFSYCETVLIPTSYFVSAKGKSMSLCIESDIDNIGIINRTRVGVGWMIIDDKIIMTRQKNLSVSGFYFGENDIWEVE